MRRISTDRLLCIVRLWAFRLLGQRKEVAELLLAKGADVNARDAFGRTPLDYYIYRWSRNELNDLLRKHGGKRGEELKAEGK